tara:strand:+ start:9391 stop:10629 length:1239 start_codon:yes stop_codon:yes gene_type:complete
MKAFEDREYIDKYKNSRPIVLISNSSNYLYHYRLLLIEKLLSQGHNVIALSPIDSTASKLSKKCLHIPLGIKRINDSNPISFYISIVKMFFILKVLKPKLVHSHTIKINFITIIVSCIFEIPTIISFSGVGRLSNSSKLSKFIFSLVLKTINFLSKRFIYTKDKNYSKVRFIFQNKEDMQNYISTTNSQNINICKLIEGSGVPSQYKNISLKKMNFYPENLNNEKCKFTLIYCARLLKQKGILEFIDLARSYADHNYFIFGPIDKGSKDSISEAELEKSIKEIPHLKYFGNIKDPLLNLKCKKPILLVPSVYSEGLPRGILEAIVLNIPVITNDFTAKKLSNKISKYIYVVNKSERKNYVNAIKKLIKDHENGKLLIKLQNGRKNILANYQEEAIVIRTLNLYKEILKNDNY